METNIRGSPRASSLCTWPWASAFSFLLALSLYCALHQTFIHRCRCFPVPMTAHALLLPLSRKMPTKPWHPLTHQSMLIMVSLTSALFAPLRLTRPPLRARLIGTKACLQCSATAALLSSIFTATSLVCYHIGAFLPIQPAGPPVGRPVNIGPELTAIALMVSRIRGVP